MRKVILALLISATVSSCSTTTTEIKKENLDREYQISAYLWFQYSAEYKALMYQAYNTAESMVARDLKVKRKKKRAVIFDVDETVLDNSYAGANEIKNNIKWHEGLFAEWVKLKKATALPGARDFVKYLNANQVEVFFISNRRDAWFEETFQNLLSEGFNIKRDSLILMGEVKSKEQRRQEIAKKYEIILLIGDTLLDLHTDFDGKSMEERSKMVDQHRQDFGKRFIVLPNPMYGDWENILPKTKKRSDLLKVIP